MPTTTAHRPDDDAPDSAPAADTEPGPHSGTRRRDSVRHASGRRVLVITDYFSTPPVYGTAVIAYHWARTLRRRGYAVELLTAREGWDEDWNAFCHEHGITRAPVQVRWHSKARQAIAVLQGLPPALEHVNAPALANELGTQSYDAIIVIGPHLLPLAERLQDEHNVVFVPTDAISMVLETRQGQRPLRPVHARWALEARLWRRVEAKRLPKLEASVFVAPADAAEATRAWPESARQRVHVIPNGVDIEYFSPLDAPEVPYTLAFTGNLWAYDSVRGALWFIEDVFPHVIAAAPRTQLHLAGRNPAPELTEAASANERIEIHANVPDLRPHVGHAAVYVCPLLSGGGVKNRLLEAMAMGRAIVTTPECADALGLEDGGVLRVARDPDAFAEAVVELLDDEDERRRLGNAARETVVTEFSWATGVARLEKIIDAL